MGASTRFLWHLFLASSSWPRLKGRARLRASSLPRYSCVVKLGDVLRRLKDHLDARGQPWLLVGGHALAAYGWARATLDLDLLVPGEAQAELVDFMEKLGYETLHRSTGYSNHLHQAADFGRVEFVYVRGDTRRELFAAAQQAIGPQGIPVLVPKAEHLIAMKVRAMASDPSRRFQEMADIAALLAATPVDQNEVRGYFERAGLLESWHELE